MKRKLSIMFLAALLLTLPCVAQTPEAPAYVLSSGISFDAIAHQASSVSTLGIRITDIKGLPTYQTTTIETAFRTATTAATLRGGLAQTVFQRGNIALGICTDIGMTKAGDEVTLGTLTGCGWLAWDVGQWATRGRAHVFIIPTYRMIAINGVQVKPSYALRIGTGF